MENAVLTCLKMHSENGKNPAWNQLHNQLFRQVEDSPLFVKLPHTLDYIENAVTKQVCEAVEHPLTAAIWESF